MALFLVSTRYKVHFSGTVGRRLVGQKRVKVPLVHLLWLLVYPANRRLTHARSLATFRVDAGQRSCRALRRTAGQWSNDDPLGTGLGRTRRVLIVGQAAPSITAFRVESFRSVCQAGISKRHSGIRLPEYHPET